MLTFIVFLVFCAQNFLFVVSVFFDQTHKSLSHGAGSVITTCKLRIMDCEPVMNIAEQMLQKKVNQIIMDASALKEAFGELDWSSDSVTLTLSNSAPYFQLSTSSAAGSCEVNIIFYFFFETLISLRFFVASSPQLYNIYTTTNKLTK